MSHLQGTTVALLSSLQEAVAADCWSLQAQGGGSVLQAAGLPGAQVLLVVGAAAAAEGARDVPAGQRDRQTDSRTVWDRTCWRFEPMLSASRYLRAPAMMQLSPEQTQRLESSWFMPRLCPISWASVAPTAMALLL